MLSNDVIRSGEHVLTICNACRYCEGYCPVFPAIERRLDFSKGDLSYLANLCHNCGECLYACQYAPPHEFALNLPRTLAQIRVASYEEYCWPQFLGSAFRRAGLLTSFILSMTLIAVMGGVTLLFRTTPASPPVGNFYAVVPHHVLVALFGGVSVFVLTALLVGILRFWRDAQLRSADVVQVSAIMTGLRDAATLTHLHDNGVDCAHTEETRSPFRRWFHHFTAGGFMLCFASTCVAAFYHTVLGWQAPYAYTSVPVVLGTAGGIGLVVGPAGLFALRQRSDPALDDPSQQGLDVSFIALLLLSSLTGLLLLIAREHSWMAALLIVHLGFVLTLFVMLPYGKFVHGLYRTAALIKSALEASRESPGLDLDDLDAVSSPYDSMSATAPPEAVAVLQGD